jgi:hypothetical protein
MSTEDEMTIDERRKYLRKMKPLYLQADRKTKKRMLDEMETVTGLERKTLIHLLHSNLKRRRRRRERGKSYGPEVDDALRVIDESYDYICPERLTPNLSRMAQQLAAHGELIVYPALLQQLDQISVTTVKRRLNRIARDQPRLARPTPLPSSPLLQAIPMRRIPWDTVQPGHFEVDLVHHCGPSAAGDYMCTLQMVDVALGWSERVPVLGRSYLVVRDAFLYILFRLPFLVRQVHPDNGGEFFNHHILRFWQDKAPYVALSRSRPYHKNDNRFVEQRNCAWVRHYLGDDRLDTSAQTLAVNTLYDNLWLYNNFFQPVMRLAEKTVITNADGQPHIQRRHDQASTPFDRLCATDAIARETREQLETLRDRTNPRLLRQEIYDQIDFIFSLPNASTGVTENVYQTLMTHTHPQVGQRALPMFAAGPNARPQE